MNEQEAIKIIESSNAKLQTAIDSLQGSAPVVSDKLKQKYGYTLEEALNEKKACELAIKALEKQIPIKPNKYGCCPICTTYGKDDDGIEGDYCPGCGQRLDWSDKR